MVNRAKVLASLDLFGNCDPSLAFIMGGALVVTAIGCRLVWTRARPVFAPSFQVPGNRSIAVLLAAGAALFGIGCGRVGPLSSTGDFSAQLGQRNGYGFLIAMGAGMARSLKNG